MTELKIADLKAVKGAGGYQAPKGHYGHDPKGGKKS